MQKPGQTLIEKPRGGRIVVEQVLIAEGEIDIPAGATCTSLIETAERAVRAQISSGYFENELVGVRFPVMPGARFGFRRSGFRGGYGWEKRDDVSTNAFRQGMLSEGFTGNVAAWLALIAQRFHGLGTVFTLLSEQEPLQFDNKPSCTPHLMIGTGGSGLFLRDVGSTLRCDSEIWSFRKKT